MTGPVLIFSVFMPEKVVREAEAYLAFWDEVRKLSCGGWTWEYCVQLADIQSQHDLYTQPIASRRAGEVI